MATTQSGLGSRTWKRNWKGLRKINKKEMMALELAELAENNIILTENDIPSASLAGRNPSPLKNEELKFWLRCRSDSLKGLKT